MTTLDEFIEDLKRQIEDEISASNKYQDLAVTADKLGHRSVGKSLREISESEKRHHVRLELIVRTLSALWARGSTELPRLFPKTYGDWSDLGMDIKERDPSISTEVNNALTEIYERVPASDDAKRWLVSKASELNIT